MNINEARKTKKSIWKREVKAKIKKKNATNANR